VIRATHFDDSRAAWFRDGGWWADETITDTLVRCAHSFAQKAAIVDGDTTLSFATLNELTARLAGALAAHGIGRGDVVSWQLPNWWEAAVVHLATARLGAVSNPLQMIYRQSELRFVVAQAGSKALFVPHEFRGVPYAAHAQEVCEALAGRPLLVAVRGPDCSFPALLERGEDERTSSSPDDVVLLLYTSGTTAEPKGALHSHNTLQRAGQDLIAHFGIASDDVLFVPSPMTHITGLLYGVQVPAVLGATAVLLDRWEPAVALDLVVNNGCTFTGGATPFVRGFVDAARARGMGPTDVPLSRGSCGGADVPPSLIVEADRALGARFSRVYGLTEGVTVTASPLVDLERCASTDGRPLPGHELRIVEGNEDVSPGAVGEIVVRGPSNFLGYLDDRLNADTFMTGSWIRTGDLGRADGAGFINVEGRKKDIVIRGGENISVREVEDLVSEHPAVADVAIVAMPDPVVGERACAYVVTRPGTDLTLPELVGFLRAKQIAPQKYPERLVILPGELPKTPSGKVQKYKLREDIRRRLAAEPAGRA
jgi:cyclohexanecarboxylate-CoA ligase